MELDIVELNEKIYTAQPQYVDFQVQNEVREYKSAGEYYFT
jgi:hypothetical protein